MNFTSVNEKGVKKYDAIMALPKGAHFATRRIFSEKKLKQILRRMELGKPEAICPGRGKKSGCRAVVVSVTKHLDWCSGEAPSGFEKMSWGIMPPHRASEEAHLEAFETWEGLLEWFDQHKIDINQTYRIELVKL